MPCLWLWMLHDDAWYMMMDGVWYNSFLVPCCITLYHTKLYHTISHYITLYNVIYCYIMLYHTINSCLERQFTYIMLSTPSKTSSTFPIVSNTLILLSIHPVRNNPFKDDFSNRKSIFENYYTSWQEIFHIVWSVWFLIVLQCEYSIVWYSTVQRSIV